MKNLIITFLMSILIPAYALAELDNTTLKSRFEINKSLIKKDNRRKKTSNEIQFIDVEKSLQEATWDQELLVVATTDVDESKLQEVLNDSVKKYENAYNGMLKKESILKQLQNNLGNKITNDQEREILVNIISNIENQKIKQNAEKDLSKGKISKSIKEELLIAIENSERESESFLRKYLNPIKENPHYFLKRMWTEDIWPEPVITYYDTVPNPFYRKNLNPMEYYEILNQALYFPKAKEPYLWVIKEKGEEKEEKYPVRITYLSYTSHPDLRIKRNHPREEDEIFAEIYDKEGKLVAVNFPKDIDRVGENLDLSPDLLKIAKFAYLDNVYDIQSIDKNNKDYLTLELGLRDKTASEIKEDEAFAQALISGNDERFQNALTKRALERLKYTKARNWLDQIADENKDNFDMILYFERLNPTTFKVTYGDKNAQPTYDFIYNYYSKEPYSCYLNKDIVKSQYNKENDPADLALKLIPGISNLSTRYIINEGNEDILDVVGQNAEFPGFQPALKKWLEANIQYPEDARRNEIQGTVVVKMVIEKDGVVSYAEIDRGIDKDLNREALRLIDKMPRWLPAKNNGVPVRSYYRLPITFKL